MDEIEFIRELYISAYINHKRLHDVEPGYEYAVQQLCSDMVERGVIEKDQELDGMMEAKTAVFGENE